MKTKANKIKKPVIKAKPVKQDFSLTISPTAFSQAIEAFLIGGDDEIGGLCVVEDGRITWLDVAVAGLAGGVSGTGLQYAASANRCLEQTGLVPCGQWHTHPDFGTFWSSTDITDHASSVKRTIKAAKEFGIENGEMYFLVFDSLDWLVRKFWWKKEEIFYADGSVKLGNAPLDRQSMAWWNMSLKPPTKNLLFTGDYVSFPCEDGQTREGHIEDILGEEVSVIGDDGRTWTMKRPVVSLVEEEQDEINLSEEWYLPVGTKIRAHVEWTEEVEGTIISVLDFGVYRVETESSPVDVFAHEITWYELLAPEQGNGLTRSVGDEVEFLSYNGEAKVGIVEGVDDDLWYVRSDDGLWEIDPSMIVV